ncbi:hypothetical protein ACIQ6Y_31140 [Streptomyces sp. NPDC096205]|uniref:hypothetical protein n=1 Tax=Streptomyces sp. NPDC096205 TaxID=3366081 RepID=UPI00381CF55D
MKRTALAAASLLSFAAVLTACGGSGSDSDAKPESAPSSPKAKQLTPDEQLAKLMVTKAESPKYTLEEPQTKEAFATSTDEVTVDKPECAPLVYAMNDLPLGDPEARLTRVTHGGASSSMLTYVTLSTYEDGKAEAAMKELTAAAASCGGGFTATSKSDGSAMYDSVKTENAPQAGDESLATSATFDFQGLPQTVRTQTFRFGDTVANYFTLDSGAFMSARAGDAEIPADLVKAQNAKLG